MKKIVSILLVTLMLLALCACGGKEQNQNGILKAKEGTLLVGFGRVDLTPTSNLPLVGYTESRMMTGVMDPIYATCVAITDSNANTVLIYTVDTLDPGGSAVSLLRDKVAEAIGIPEDNLVVAATHTHSAPRAAGIPNYVELLTKAAVDAMKDRTSATIEAGETETERMNFVRHYYTDKGKVVGDNFGSYKEDGQRISHTTEADAQMQLIRFVRGGNKKDVLMVNWQAHPRVSSTADTQEGQASRSLLSADFIGFCRAHVEKNTDCLFAYYNGANGNLNARGSLPNENLPNGNKVNVYGERLGNYVIHALDQLEAVDAGAVAVHRKRQEVNLAGSSTVQSQDITAISIGNIGFATVPFEMFDTNGMQIKEGSPYDITFVLSCCNGKDGYIPSEYAWDYNPGDVRLMPYEVKSCAYARGTAEVVAQALVDMLNGFAAN